MKLRNKKTGEIKEVEPITIGGFRSLAELNDEWEDYEEPDEIWYIDWQGDIRSADIGNEWEREKEIGNYFETKEETEKAVEKLKAWKRLEDKGFRFIDHIDRDTGQGMARYEWEGYVNGEDLDLLFGGEE